MIFIEFFWLSITLKSILWIISGNMDAIIIVKAEIFPQLRSGVLFLQYISAKLEWKFIKINENSAFHSVSLIFHRLENILWIISGNMVVIIKVKSAVFPQLECCGVSFMQTVLGELEWKIIKIKENSMFHGISLIFHTLNSILWIIWAT